MTNHHICNIGVQRMQVSLTALAVIVLVGLYCSLHLLQDNNHPLLTTRWTSGYASRSEPTASTEQCTPLTKIYYLKIHKTGSSTFTNILQRVARSKSVKNPYFATSNMFPEPDISSYLVPYQKLLSHVTEHGDVSTFRMSDFHEEALRENRDEGMIDGHTVFNQSAIREILGEDAVMIASLRHPLSHLKSSVSYFKLWESSHFRSSDHILEYLENPSKYRDEISLWGKNRPYTMSVTRNFMAYSFGYGHLMKTTSVSDFLEHINHTFPLVVILEKFSESMLLIKRRLCWDIKDIIYIKLNSQMKKNYLKSTETPSDPVQQEALHRNLSRVDYALYDMFYQRNEDEVRHLGDDFQHELQVYEDVNAQVNAFCMQVFHTINSSKHLSQKYSTLAEVLFIDASDYHESFSVNGTECMFMILRTHYFMAYLIKQQRPHMCDLTAVLKGKYQFDKIKLFCPSDKIKENITTTTLLNPLYWMLKNPFE